MFWCYGGFFYPFKHLYSHKPFITNPKHYEGVLSTSLKSLIAQFLLISFCATRWVEDEEVAKRAIELWPNIVKVVKHWQSLSKSKCPKNVSNEKLVMHHLDKYVPLKMQFFQDVASHLNCFVEVFQTNNPMVPFLEKSLVDVFQLLLKMVVKPEVLKETGTSLKLVNLDLSKSSNLVPCELIKLPTARKALLSSTSFTNDPNKRSFNKDCKSMIVSMISKLQERSSLKYGLARFASSLSPENMINNLNRSVDFFDKIVDGLYKGAWISSKQADDAKKQYFQFIV